VKRFFELEKMLGGLDFIHGELIGWLWIAIGRSHVGKHIIIEEKGCHCKREEKDIYGMHR